MVPLLDLWLPILTAAVFVFLVSSVIHMAIPLHKNDFKRLPNEDAVLEALRRERVEPGAYIFPMCGSMKEMSSPEMIERYRRGPVGHMQVRPSGVPSIGKALGQWFLYCVVIAVFVAYIGSRGSLGLGAPASEVFQLTGTAGILGFAFGAFTESIWKGVSWLTSWKFAFDGILYGLATGASFAWLWPGV